MLNLLLFHCTTTSLYTDCRSNLYAGSPSYLLILFSALSAFAVGGLSIERNQKPLAPEITLAVTHHDRQKQVEVKRSSRVNPHEIRLSSGCPYYFTLPIAKARIVVVAADTRIKANTVNDLLGVQTLTFCIGMQPLHPALQSDPDPFLPDIFQYSHPESETSGY